MDLGCGKPHVCGGLQHADGCKPSPWPSSCHDACAGAQGAASGEASPKLTPCFLGLFPWGGGIGPLPLTPLVRPPWEL